MTAPRRAAEARGRWAEWLAMVWLSCKGYRLLDHRARTAAGEIDLVARLSLIHIPEPTGQEASA